MSAEDQDKTEVIYCIKRLNFDFFFVEEEKANNN